MNASMPPDRNLALELVRVTEAAALASAQLVGMGDKEAADQAAVDGMHAVLHTVHMDGIVVIGDTLGLVAERKGTDVRDVMVVVLDRPRHEEGIRQIREAGARVRLITDGDVSGALLAVAPDRPVDLLWGIGGTPEGVISAAALKCYGGGLIGRLWPRDDDERRRAEEAGYDVDKVLTQDDLVQGQNCFFSATGVTDGDVLDGVRYTSTRGATTESLVMRSRSGTVRRIQSRHDRGKLRALTGYRHG